MNTVEHPESKASADAPSDLFPRAEPVTAPVVATDAEPVEPEAPRKGGRQTTPWIASLVLLLALGGVGFALWTFKEQSTLEARELAASLPEPVETVRVATASAREFRGSTVSIGTVVALRSVRLRNELPGTVQSVALVPGEIVDEGDVLIAFDVSVEEAELRAQEAEVAVTASALQRLERAGRAAPAIDVDRARAEHDIAIARAARTRAIIAKKTLRAPFRARVGLADVHPGQYLNEGAELTTLQGVGDAVHVDFAVTQQVAAGLRVGDEVQIASGDRAAARARIVALDSRVDELTRNTQLRARLEGADLPSPGASVRVQIPVGTPQVATSIPIDALRKGPQGEHVFVVVTDDAGVARAGFRRVESGPVVDGHTLIRAGLEPGEQVATSGSFKLRDGVRLAIAEASVPDPSAR